MYNLKPSKYKYEDLDRHFTAPKVISPFYRYKRIPRKLKKQIKGRGRNIFNKKVTFRELYNGDDINTILWYTLEGRNVDYKRFIIKKICET